MTVNAPPGMQSWIRKVDASLALQNQQLSILRESLVQAQQRPKVAAASIDGFTNGSAGAPFSTWRKLAANLGPNVVVTTRTGLIKVTVSTNMVGNWTTGIDSSLYMAMGFSVDTPFSTDTNLAAESLRAFMVSFDYFDGQPEARNIGGSRTRILQVSPGTYTLRSEYFYNIFTAGVLPSWQYRSIVAEPL